MKNHWFRMLIACAAPILLIFLLPLFGVTTNLTFFLFIAVFFFAHLFIMRGHSHVHNGHQGQNAQDEQGSKPKHSHH